MLELQTEIEYRSLIFASSYHPDSALHPLLDICYAVAAATPVASFQSSDSTICANDCISFTDLSTNATSWQWSFNGANPSSSTLQNPQNVCYLNSGNYDVTLIASNSGGSDTMTISNFIAVNFASPVPVITQIGTTLYCSTDSSYASYQWYSDTTLIAGATDTLLIITNGGNYNVQVSNDNGCKIAVGINIILGIQDYTNDNIISLSPNPVRDKFTIYDLQFTITQMVIYNVLGQVCSQAEIANHKSGIVINVSSLPAGIYFLQMKSENGSTVKRFVNE